MRHAHSILAVIAVLIAGASASAQTLQFSLTDLGTFGGVSSDAKAVNANGEIVGYYATSTAQQKCFYWKSSVNGGYSTWTSPNAGGTCIVYSINNNGIMAGTSTLTNGNYSAFSATRVYSCDSHRLCTWGINSTYLSSPYGLSTYGASISGAGDVVGTISDGPSTTRAGIWKSNTYSQLAGDISWGTVSANDCTYFCGEALTYYSQTISGQTRAYEYDNTYHEIDYELGPLSSIPTVNSQVTSSFPEAVVWLVGWSYGADNTMHAVQWLTAYCPYYPSTCPSQDIGGSNSYATGALGDPYNDYYTEIIGQWQGGSVPFLRQQTLDPTCGIVVNLQSLLDSSGSGWTLLEANAINYVPNSFSYYIVGSARNSLNQTHAVRLTSNGGTLCP